MQRGPGKVSVPRAAVFVAIVGLLCGLVSVADASQHGKAQARQPEMTGRMGAPEMTLQGPVVAVDAGAGFLVVRQGTGRDAEEIPVEIDAKTMLTRGGTKVNLDTVKAGDRVKVRYSGQPGDVAKTVEVTPGKPMPAAKRRM